jgi:hypothetical protein
LHWNTYNLPLENNKEYRTVMARRIRFSYSASIKQFKELLPIIGPVITFAQVKKLPPAI